MSLYVALFVVFDSFVNTLPMFQMPQGGSLGLSVIALLMAGYHLGWKCGLIVSITSVFLQFVTGPMYTPDLLGFLLDYFFAFSVYGFAACFPNYKMFYSGVLMTNIFRTMFSTLSGVFVWGVSLEGSIAYQLTYMVPTTIVTLIVIPLLMNLLKPVMKD